MIRETLQNIIKEALTSLDIQETEIALVHPEDLGHGDYATNVALVVANKIGENPIALAENLISFINTHKPEEVERVDIAGPGFINFYLTEHFFAQSIREILDAGDDFGKSDVFKGQKMLVEYTDPNILKPFHVGHLMANCIGEALAHLFEASGAEVVRANYQGDVGMHVAKALWGIQKLINEKPTDRASLSEKIAFIGKAYVEGATAFEGDESAQVAIKKINKQVYEKDDEDIEELYQWGRKVSLDHFEEIYAMLGTRFDHYFFESDVAYDGKQIVEEYLEKGVFEESSGAIIFDGEKHSLHKRVFINSEGIPTYEAKDIGLNIRKFNLIDDIDESIIITANEQDEYFKVVLKALEEIRPDIAQKTKHMSHGMMRGLGGKFSSRKGNAPGGVELIEELRSRVRTILEERDLSEEEKERIAEQVAVGAIKFTVLRGSIGKDIVFDIEQSISLEGDSGPYVQYAHTRANAVVEKARGLGITPSVTSEDGWETCVLERMLYQLPEVVERAGSEHAPHHLATYLLQVASTFNSFYGQERIADTEDKSAPYKLAITHAVRHILKNGLTILGIPVPKRM